MWPIIHVIGTYGYQSAFLWFGLGQGIVVLVMSQFLRAPLPGQAPKAAPRLTQSARDYTWTEMIQTPVFWVLYVMFVLVAASGLIVTAQVAPIAKDYKIASTVVFLGGTVLVTAGIVDNILNGLARPTFGWISDHMRGNAGRAAQRSRLCGAAPGSRQGLVRDPIKQNRPHLPARRPEARAAARRSGFPLARE